MNVTYKNLVNVSFEELHKTFVDAFSDYAVDVSYMTHYVMENRAIKNGYDPESSVGAFNDSKLVGFTLVGIDNHYETPSAFDIMTGLVKDYRGKGIASQMFDFIIPSLKEKKIKQFYLEVLQENNAAIRAYQKAGFKINRSLDCFTLDIKKLKITEQLRIPLSFKNLDKSIIDYFETFADWTPSWENSFSAIKRIPDDVLIIEAEYSINKVGLIVYYPTLNWIMAFLVDPKYRKIGVGSALIKKLIDEINGSVDIIKFLNIQSEDEDLINFLKASGFELMTGQYEMTYKLS
ncbi:MAG: GNAT family N-acetyltransferase [Bacteroidales bacterium]|nr:GNAT family N-acetyltransferase [Bacteroidales bacterium]